MAACGKDGENADVTHNNISADSEANAKSISGYERDRKSTRLNSSHSV